MGKVIDIPRIQEALVLLGQCSPDMQLISLKNLCQTNGIWTVPENHRDYSPVLYEVSLFGVPAIADEIEALPTNWRRAAQNVLNNLSSQGHA